MLNVPAALQSFADLIAFDTAHADEELVPPLCANQTKYVFLFHVRFYPSLTPARFIASENTTLDTAYFVALAADQDPGQARRIDVTLAADSLNVLILPQAKPGNRSGSHSSNIRQWVCAPEMTRPLIGQACQSVSHCYGN